MNKDKAMQRLLRSADIPAIPPKGVRERIFDRVISMEIKPALSPVEKFFFTNPLRAACAIAVPATGLLWAATGGNFIGLLSGLIH